MCQAIVIRDEAGPRKKTLSIYEACERPAVSLTATIPPHMTLLYHFSPRRNVEGIFSDKVIRKGQVATDTGPRPSTAVNLTSDPRPEGHGLPDGRQITEGQAIRLRWVAAPLENGKRFSVDFTKYRLAAEIPNGDARLVSAKQHHSSNPLLLPALELSALFPVHEPPISDMDLAEARRAVSRGELELKGSTWWYFFDDIPLAWVGEVAVKTPGGSYFPMPTADFAERLAEDVEFRRKRGAR